MKDAFGYVRVSTRKQTEGDGPERQRQHIQDFADKNGYRIARWFTDSMTGSSKGVSFSAVEQEMKDRQAMTEMLLAVQETRVKVIIVEKADRFARDIIVSEMFIRQIRAIKCALIDAETGKDVTEGDDNQPTLKLIRQILAVVAEYNRSELVMKMRLARARIRASGKKCEGPHRFGARPGEAETLARIKAMYRAGMGCMRIANALNELYPQFPPRTGAGGSEWWAGTIKGLLQREGIYIPRRDKRKDLPPISEAPQAPFAFANAAEVLLSESGTVTVTVEIKQPEMAEVSQ